MITMGVSEARSHLGALLDRVERGEAVIITRRGVPVLLIPADDGCPTSRSFFARCGMPRILTVCLKGQSRVGGISVARRLATTGLWHPTSREKRARYGLPIVRGWDKSWTLGVRVLGLDHSRIELGNHGIEGRRLQRG